MKTATMLALLLAVSTLAFVPSTLAHAGISSPSSSPTIPRLPRCPVPDPCAWTYPMPGCDCRCGVITCDADPGKGSFGPFCPGDLCQYFEPLPDCECRCGVIICPYRGGMPFAPDPWIHLDSRPWFVTPPECVRRCERVACPYPVTPFHPPRVTK